MSDWKAILERAQARVPNAEVVERLIERELPGRSVTAVSRLHGGLGAVLHRIDLDPRPRDIEALVLRQLMPEWGETGDDLLRKATTLGRLDHLGVLPVPTV